MSSGDKFFIIYFITVLIIRLFLFVHPTSGMTVKGYRIHHYVYGVIGMPIAIITGSLPLCAVSLGLFEDELTYQIIGGRDHRDNYSWVSLMGTILIVAITFFLRNSIVRLVT